MQRNTDHLVAVGPRHPVTSFPLWFKDSTGLLLELGLDRADPFLPAIGDVPAAPAPAPFAADFPDESFYWLADARLTVLGGDVPGRARLVLALEAAFGGTGDVAPGQQMVFGRLRVRIDGGVPGADYVVTHPFGETGSLRADGRGRVFVTDDVGAVPLGFDGALSSEVGPFLRWTSGAELAPGETEAPAGYVGDGATEHTVTGSPFGTNVFRVRGPGVGGPGSDVVETALFTVQGKRATVVGVDVARAVYSRDAAGAVVVDVVAGSEPGQAVEAVVDAGGAPSRIALRATGGRYFGRLDAGTAVPAEVLVVNVGDEPPSTTPAAVTDAVVVTRAEYDIAARTLTVEAASSDLAVPPVLTASDGIGALAAGSATVTLDAPPARVTVTSSRPGAAGPGGVGQRDVTVTGPPSPPAPQPAPAARVAAEPVAVPGATVVLDGSASTGATAFAWTQTAGADVGAVSGAATDRATFVMPAAGGPVTFRLTVSGPGGPAATADVTVGVSTDALLVSGAQFRTASGRWRVRGTATGVAPDTVTVTYEGGDLGSALVDATGAWDVRLTLVAGDGRPRPVPGRTVDVVSSRGGAVTAAVTVRS